ESKQETEPTAISRLKPYRIFGPRRLAWSPTQVPHRSGRTEVPRILGVTRILGGRSDSCSAPIQEQDRESHRRPSSLPLVPGHLLGAEPAVGAIPVVVRRHIGYRHGDGHIFMEWGSQGYSAYGGIAIRATSGPCVVGLSEKSRIFG